MTDGREQRIPQHGRLPYWVAESGVLQRTRPSDDKVYLVIVAHSKDWSARLGMRRIAKLTGLQLGTVSEAARRLQALGLIRINHAGNGHAQSYTVQHTPNGQAFSTHRTDNGNRSAGTEPDRSAYTGGTVRQAPPNRSAPAERNTLNIDEHHHEQGGAGGGSDEKLAEKLAQILADRAPDVLGRVAKARHAAANGWTPHKLGEAIDASHSKSKPAAWLAWALAQPADELAIEPAQPPSAAYQRQPTEEERRIQAKRLAAIERRKQRAQDPPVSAAYQKREPTEAQRTIDRRMAEIRRNKAAGDAVEATTT